VAANDSQQQHPAFLSPEVLLQGCDVKRTRGSGPGGQHRNKVETAIVITHRSSAIRGEATERRSQEQNRRQAVQRLRIKLALGVRTPMFETPSDLWRSRCSGKRIQISAEHEDFPALLAECLNVLTEKAIHLPQVAEFFNSTSSQLVRFLKVEPLALQQVNQQRQEAGLGPLR